MTKYERLQKTVGEYIQARIKLTKCRQVEFKLLCQKCKRYDTCKVYAEYVDKWIKLQKEVR